MDFYTPDKYNAALKLSWLDRAHRLISKGETCVRRRVFYENIPYTKTNIVLTFMYTTALDSIHMWKCKTKLKQRKKKRKKSIEQGLSYGLAFTLLCCRCRFGKHTSKARIRRRRTRELGALLREGRMEEHFKKAISLFIFFTATALQTVSQVRQSHRTVFSMFSITLFHIGLLITSFCFCFLHIQLCIEWKTVVWWYEILHSARKPSLTHTKAVKKIVCEERQKKEGYKANLSWKTNFV